MLDIGANIGLSTLPPAARGWQVIAFEPNANNVKRLKLNLALNGFHSDTHVHVVHAAISNASGEATLFSPAQEQFAAVSSLTRSNMHYYRRTRAQPLLRKTPLLRLDDYFGHAERRGRAADTSDRSGRVAAGHATGPLPTAGRTLWGSVGVIKIDVQGHELNVLRGMGDLLGSAPHPVILMEYEEPLQIGAGFEPMEVLVYLKSKGYRAFCPSVNGTIDSAAMPKEDKGVNAQKEADVVLFDDTEQIRGVVLSGSTHGSREPSKAQGVATWVLGNALEPQRGKPRCIDAVFLHHSRLRSSL